MSGCPVSGCPVGCVSSLLRWQYDSAEVGSVARDTWLLDLSGTRRSAWLYKLRKIVRIAIGSSRVTLGNPVFYG